MPSPFAGMDPYLEDPRHWPDVHSRLNNAISELIGYQVSPNFTVHIEKRVYIASHAEIRDQVIAPAVYVVQREARPTRGSATTLISPSAKVIPRYVDARSIPRPSSLPADANWAAARIREWQQARATHEQA